MVTKKIRLGSESQEPRGAFAIITAFEHWPKKKPARAQLPEPWLNWPGEGAEKHSSTLFVGERQAEMIAAALLASRV